MKRREISYSLDNLSVASLRSGLVSLGMVAGFNRNVWPICSEYAARFGTRLLIMKKASTPISSITLIRISMSAQNAKRRLIESMKWSGG